jgi:hypothetical protein
MPHTERGLRFFLSGDPRLESDIPPEFQGRDLDSTKSATTGSSRKNRMDGATYWCRISMSSRSTNESSSPRCLRGSSSPSWARGDWNR